MENKLCTRCNTIKPLSEYYLRCKTKDPKPAHICKECRRVQARRTGVRIYDPKKQKVKSLKRSLSGKSAETTHRMMEKYPGKYKARYKFRNAVNAGKIVKGEFCQTIFSDICNGRLEAHHYLGYEGEHWKDVEWLCNKHHHKMHRIDSLSVQDTGEECKCGCHWTADKKFRENPCIHCQGKDAKK